ncbi:uncharacterized protein [Primulina huaijiensis]|uniref:uncharacterized protein n=1 Tax=Primulina huaijiensis TaxID=1492673 RepID=UPI003CC6F419
MVGEAANSSAQGPETDKNLNSVEATIQSGVDFGCAESTCNNSNNESNGESSVVVCGVGRSLGYAVELMVRGSNAFEERDYAEATDCFSRALEIRVAHFGELAPECVSAYYKYGRALLRKAQEEVDPLASMAKKEGVSQEDCDKDEEGADPLASMAKKEGVSQEDCDEDGSVKSSVNGGSSATSVSTIEQEGSTNGLDEVTG